MQQLGDVCLSILRKSVCESEEACTQFSLMLTIQTEHLNRQEYFYNGYCGPLGGGTKSFSGHFAS